MSNPAFPSDLAGSLTGEPVPPTLADFRNGSLPDAVGSRLRIQAVLPDYILRDLVRLLPACWAVDVSAPYRDEPPVSGDLVVIDTSLIGCQVEYKTAVNLIGEKSVVPVAGLHVLPIENALSITKKSSLLIEPLKS